MNYSYHFCSPYQFTAKLDDIWFFHLQTFFLNKLHECVLWWRYICIYWLEYTSALYMHVIWNLIGSTKLNSTKLNFIINLHSIWLDVFSENWTGWIFRFIFLLVQCWSIYDIHKFSCNYIKLKSFHDFYWFCWFLHENGKRTPPRAAAPRISPNHWKHQQINSSRRDAIRPEIMEII